MAHKRTRSFTVEVPDTDIDGIISLLGDTKDLRERISQFGVLPKDHDEDMAELIEIIDEMNRDLFDYLGEAEKAAVKKAEAAG